jgi:hypothetical protein
MSSDEVAGIGERRVAEMKQPTNAPAALPSTVESVMAGLSETIRAMQCDDLNVELTCHQEGNRTHASFRLRAYRSCKKVLDEERNV